MKNNEENQRLLKRGMVLLIYNNRGPMADRNPYRYAIVGYRPQTQERKKTNAVRTGTAPKP